LIPGFIPVSNSRFDVRVFINPGRKKAIKTQAAEFNPREFEKISTLKPIKNADERSSHFGVSKGKSKIK